MMGRIVVSVRLMVIWWGNIVSMLNLSKVVGDDKKLCDV